MTINDKHVTSQAQGNLNTVLGAVGTAGAMFGGNGLFGNLFGNRNGCGNNDCGYGCSDNQPVTRYDANLLLALNAKTQKSPILSRINTPIKRLLR